MSERDVHLNTTETVCSVSRPDVAVSNATRIQVYNDLTNVCENVQYRKFVQAQHRVVITSNKNTCLSGQHRTSNARSSCASTPTSHYPQQFAEQVIMVVDAASSPSIYVGVRGQVQSGGTGSTCAGRASIVHDILKGNSILQPAAGGGDQHTTLHDRQGTLCIYAENQALRKSVKIDS